MIKPPPIVQPPPIPKQVPTPPPKVGPTQGKPPKGPTTPTPENAAQTAYEYEAPDPVTGGISSWEEYIDNRIALEKDTFGKIVKHRESLDDIGWDMRRDAARWDRDEFKDYVHRYIKASKETSKATAFKNVPRVPKGKSRLDKYWGEKALTGDEKGWAEEAIKDFQDLMPRVGKADTVVTVKRATHYSGIRGHCLYNEFGYPGENHIGMRPYGSAFATPSDWKSTVVHELVHAWDRNTPKAKRFREVYMRRRMLNVTGRRAGKGAKQFDDKLMRGYSGFFKDGEWVEALSTGIQQMYYEPYRMYQYDPEWFYFILSVMRGIV